MTRTPKSVSVVQVTTKMNNPRITEEDEKLIKNAIRRVFSRSELRKAVILASALPDHTDETRKRVKNWCRCNVCKTPTPRSYMECDHIEPVVPVTKSLKEIPIMTLIDNVWCHKNNLQAICETCHDIKSKAENAERRRIKKEKKNAGVK